MNSQMAKRLIPSLNRVFPSKTATGALLPENATKLNSGTVIGVGSGARDRDGDHIPEENYRYHVGSSRGAETTHTTQFVSRGFISGTKSCWHNSSSLAGFSLKTRFISSQAGAESGEEEDDVDDGFSELGTPNSDTIKEKSLEESEDDLLSGPELSDNDEADDKLTEVSPNELDLSDTDPIANKESSSKHKLPEIYRVIMSANRDSLAADLDKWEQEGNSVTSVDISQTLLNLRKRRFYLKALQFSEWLEAKGKLEFSERDYASRLDLIAKVRGLVKAEKYIADIPESFRGEVIYRTLLANTVSATDLKKSEAVFNKMKDLGFTITAFACNQLLLLYKRLDRKKIADVLLFMEKENIQPTLFTYRLLIDTKGQTNDITGMEKLVDTMKEQGLEPDHSVQSMLAKYYIRGGLKEKAETVLKEMEGADLKGNRVAIRALLPLYAELGKVDEVGRIWKKCKANPYMEECLAAIEAWGKLGKIEEAEAVFERMGKTWKKLPAKSYTTLLKVYANHKLLVKGKELAKQMSDSGVRIGPLMWDALVKLYVEAGELEKADSILQKAVQQKQTKALFSTYMYVMDQYAKRGDIHNAEKIFHNLKQAGYVGRARQYQSLLDAYINAKVPGYGFRERMKADEIFPNRFLQGKLAQIDAFKKTAITDLLD